MYGGAGGGGSGDPAIGDLTDAAISVPLSDDKE